MPYNRIQLNLLPLFVGMSLRLYLPPPPPTDLLSDYSIVIIIDPPKRDDSHVPHVSARFNSPKNHGGDHLAALLRNC